MTSDLDLCIRLNRMLDWDIQQRRKFDLYYHGRQPLALLPESVLADCGDRLPDVRVGFPRLVVDALAERIELAGFKVPDEEISAELWETFQRSDGDEVSELAHLDALIAGRSAIMVWAGPDGRPRITVESARHCIVFQMPGLQHRIAGLKRWVDGEGQPYCTLFTPTTVTRWRSPNKIALDPWLNPSTVGNPAYAFDSYAMYDWSQLPATGWEMRDAPRPNPLGVVPIIPLINRPRLLNPMGESELVDILPLADAMNLLSTDLLVSAEMGSQIRRWVTGIEITVDAEGNPVDPFSRAPGRNWLAENPETKFGQFAEQQLTQYGEAIFKLTQQLGALAGLPGHYLGIAPAESSADAIRSAESALVRRVQRKCRQFGGAWEEAMRIADVIAHGYRRPQLEMMEAVWADPETRTVAQSADAAVKLTRDVGIPLKQVAEDLGYSPQEIAKMPDEAPVPVAPNGVAPLPDAPETQREIRRDGNDAAR